MTQVALMLARSRGGAGHAKVAAPLSDSRWFLSLSLALALVHCGELSIAHTLILIGKVVGVVSVDIRQFNGWPYRAQAHSSPVKRLSHASAKCSKFVYSWPSVYKYKYI